MVCEPLCSIYYLLSAHFSSYNFSEGYILKYMSIIGVDCYVNKYLQPNRNCYLIFQMSVIEDHWKAVSLVIAL